MSDTLFFGIDLSHPAGGFVMSDENSDPTTIGFASNIYGGLANMAKGDFGYQKSRDTLIESSLLAEKFTNAVLAYFRNSAKFPKWIVVYRAGLSEGEVQKVCSYLAVFGK